jgi:hypothetical protein
VACRIDKSFPVKVNQTILWKCGVASRGECQNFAQMGRKRWEDPYLEVCLTLRSDWANIKQARFGRVSKKDVSPAHFRKWRNSVKKLRIDWKLTTLLHNTFCGRVDMAVSEMSD